jgi:adenylate cyclase class 2
MAEENEAKFYLQRPAEFQQHIESLGAKVVEARVYELNLRFDTPGLDLRRAAQVLRLRQDRRARLTYKDSESIVSGSLSRRELEITVSDFGVTKELLEALGFEVVFIYEKYRTTYELDEVEVVLDELPYGQFVEVEGERNSLRTAAEKLGLDWEAAIPASYSRLFEHLRASRALEFRDLTFENIRGFRVLPADLGVRPADRK